VAVNPDGAVNGGATAWLLASTALVLVMTPGVAFFYGGMVRQKNVLGIVMQGFATIGVVAIVWVTIGFTLAFGGGRWIGDLRFLGLNDPGDSVPGYPNLSVPLFAFVAFHLMFAAITPALLTGATAERWRFGPFLLFVALWSVLVYAPIAHWVFSPAGWANRMGALDFAGGTVVHANCGAGALAMAVVLGRRRGWPEAQYRPHNLPLVMIGTALLWFGWFGFNGGSALSADGVAAAAVLNTQLGASGGLLAWVLVERMRFGKGTTLGAASGAVSGLVAITPAAGYVAPLSAIAIGLIAGATCQLLVGLKSWFGLDDALDVVAVHLGAGVIGSLCVGLFATTAVNPKGADGLFYGGGYRLVGVQALAIVVVVMYSLVMTVLIGGLTNRLLGNRARAREEIAGLDLSQHGEAAYELAPTPVATTTPTSPAPAGPPLQPDGPTGPTAKASLARTGPAHMR
jgi:ammonium transporter, Amt family